MCRKRCYICKIYAIYAFLLLFCREIYFATIYAVSWREKMSPKVYLWRKMTNMRSAHALKERRQNMWTSPQEEWYVRMQQQQRSSGRCSLEEQWNSRPWRHSIVISALVVFDDFIRMDRACWCYNVFSVFFSFVYSSSTLYLSITKIVLVDFQRNNFHDCPFNSSIQDMFMC